MRFLAPLAIAVALVASSPSYAQGIPVHDNANLVQTLATVKNTLDMIKQGEQRIAQADQLFGSLNKLTNVNQIASSLSTDALRHLMPNGARDIQQLMSSDISGLGNLGSAASRIRTANLVSLPSLRPDATSSEQARRAALSKNGDAAARDAAIAEAAYGVTTQRTSGLEELRSSLDGATDAKDVMDIQARIGVETAHIQNDNVQLQALRMRQQADTELRSQRESEQILANKLASLNQ